MKRRAGQAFKSGFVEFQGSSELRSADPRIRGSEPLLLVPLLTTTTNYHYINRNSNTPITGGAN